LVQVNHLLVTSLKCRQNKSRNSAAKIKGLRMMGEKLV
jgi:hypothetical protein